MVIFTVIGTWNTFYCNLWNSRLLSGRTKFKWSGWKPSAKKQSRKRSTVSNYFGVISCIIEICKSYASWSVLRNQVSLVDIILLVFPLIGQRGRSYVAYYYLNSFGLCFFGSKDVISLPVNSMGRNSQLDMLIPSIFNWQIQTLV